MGRWRDYTIEIEYDGYPGDEFTVNEISKFDALKYYFNHIHMSTKSQEECEKVTFIVKEKEQ